MPEPIRRRGRPELPADARRQHWHGTIDPATADRIRELAADLGISQAAVIDRAVARLRVRPAKRD